MTTSDASPPIPLEGVGDEAPSVDVATTMAKAIEQLANELFAQGLPSSASVPGWGPPSGRPSALGWGAGGASPSLSAPPVPGPLKQPSVPVTPPPKESDFRSVSGTLSDALGLSSSAPFSSAFSSVSPSSAFSSAPPSNVPFSSPPLSTAGEPAEATPYFLQIAGPTASPDRDASAFSPPPSPSASAEAPAAGPAPGAHFPSAAAFPTGGFRPELVPDLGKTDRFSDGLSIKKDFPILRERVHGRPLVWLDNAATTQKPQAVIDRLSRFYSYENSNVHRAAHALAARATDAYEAARDTVRRFLNAPSAQDIVFARGTTEAVNLVARSWGGRFVGEGDEIVITHLEHHANIVPWQKLCADKGARLRVAPVDARGQVILEEYEKLFGPRTRLASFSQVSNALGTVVPAREMVSIAHRYGALAMVDGAQAVSHMRVDVQDLDCDFYCFSGHKVFGPMGIGALYGRREVLQSMPPWQGGGNMISDVTFEKTTYQPPPQRFEAGTGSIADAVGLGAAIDYVSALGMENVTRYEHELLVYATGELARVPGLHMVGTAPDKAGVLSFVIDGLRTEDIGTALDQEGIAVRAGHHCAQPILRRFGLESTVRASLAPYNTCEDIDALVAALLRLQTGRPNLRTAR